MPILTREISYTDSTRQKFIGFFAIPQKQPAIASVLMAPEWWGRNDYVLERAHQLAEAGYNTFAIDMYGDKKTTEDVDTAKQWMMATFEHPNTIIERAEQALDILKAQPEVDPQKIAAVGFCYGGKVLLELARTGKNLKAIVSLHGNLSTQNPAKKQSIQGKVLICHGEKDTMVSLEDVKKFEAEMQNANVDYDILILKNAKHGFSNPLSDERGRRFKVDLAYNATATQKSMQAMYRLLKNTFTE